MEDGQIVTSLQIQHRSLDLWFRRFLAYCSRLFVASKIFTGIASLNLRVSMLSAPPVSLELSFVLLTLFTFNDVTI
jgi:hypothetical protein